MVLVREALQFVVIDALVFTAHAVGDHVISLAGEIERMPVREVAAVSQVQTHHRVTGRADGRISRLVRLRAGVRLHVGVLGPEDFPGALAGKLLDHIGEFAASVITFPGVSFRVFVGEDAGGRFQNCFRSEVLAGDQLELRMLARDFPLDGVIDFRVGFGQRPRHSVSRCHRKQLF
jgi:hypothetical protein